VTTPDALGLREAAEARPVESVTLRQGRLTYNPVTAVKLYQEHYARNRCLSPEEEGRLLEALPARLRPLVTVALNTGMRRGELQALRWSDVDFATGTLHIRRDKAGEGRWVALNSAARDALLTVNREQKVLGSYVFCSRRVGSSTTWSATGGPPWRRRRSRISDSTTAGTRSRPGWP
jgi:integrase